ncbi:MAG TPA: PEP/pyruvate-binding domain-containing protein [Levilinea sp.]|nr:PEP/pyruvate-binding domain-containing protein [Levilinea sp.]
MDSRPVRLHLISLKHGEELVTGKREELGGKAQGLLAAGAVLAALERSDFPGITVDIPPLAVLGASVFEAFIQRNNLAYLATGSRPDRRIADAFQRANLPFEVLGELRALVNRWTIPLAVRSSGLLEDIMQRPFAGVYSTKMIPNNAYDASTRFQKLVEAIKFVWASTYFKIARDYCLATGLDICNEKMAVIIQQVVGKRHGDRFYPDLSGVARSFNFYPFKPARPEDGVVSLALGMGKTIVDGGRSWTYSPAYPQAPPPFGSIDELLNQTQTGFWSINLGEPPEYDPTKETEYLRKDDLAAAESDGTLVNLASTFDMQSGRLTTGTGPRGPRALTFAPILELDRIPLNRLVRRLLANCAEHLGCPVEIEYAMTFDPHRLGFLQVRPMAVPSGGLVVSEEALRDACVVVASEQIMGNGDMQLDGDIVYVIPQRFDLKYTRQVAQELEQVNRALVAEHRPYLLIVFGRLGTLDPWLGIPVTWGQVGGAKVIVEAALENVRLEPSQGSHYFHNIANLGVIYFSVPFTSPHKVDWRWLERQPILYEGRFIRRIRPGCALHVKADGRSGRGVISRVA